MLPFITVLFSQFYREEQKSLLPSQETYGGDFNLYAAKKKSPNISTMEGVA